MQKIVSVAVQIPIKKNFDYILDTEESDITLIGRRVLVPFGTKTLTGYIIEIKDEKTFSKLKFVKEILDEEPFFNSNLIKFAEWISDYYLCSLGETLRAMTPQGFSGKSVIRAKLIKEVDEFQIMDIERQAPKRAALLREIAKSTSELSSSYLTKQLDSESVLAQLQALQKLGYIELSDEVEDLSKPKFQKAILVKEELLLDENEFKNALDKVESKSIQQSRALAHAYLTFKESGKPPTVIDTIKIVESSSAAIYALVKKGLIELIDLEVNRSAIDAEKFVFASRREIDLSLTLEQESAANALLTAIESNAFSPFLLHGVTGSGKTLVYLKAIEKCLQLNKTALILVPEISLTPQLIERFELSFPSKLSILHSKMSISERYDSWRAISAGEKPIVLGARSALFAPLDNLGIIIVDEEHEPSYKQDNPAPRYNGRDCAIVRASFENATVVLGSATPAIETMYNAKIGKYKLIEIKERADGAKLPIIKKVDMSAERKAKKNIGTFSVELIDAICEKFDKKEGVILFQNRRGFSTYIECPDCGTIPKCKNCDLTLTYHKRQNEMRCHFCGYAESARTSCKACGSGAIRQVGFGSQRVEEEIEAALKERNRFPIVQRLDLDSASAKGAHKRILSKFATGDTDILVGTQMVAKGLDFERVTLVGVINADLELNHPDFRANERTFSLLTQVAGRAGRRGDKQGEVIIQTSRADNYAIESAIQGDYEKLYNTEIEYRKNAVYPPFCRFSMIEFQADEDKDAFQAAKQFYSILPKGRNDLIVIPPCAPTVAFLRNKYRYIIALKDVKAFDASGKTMRTILNKCLELYESQKFNNKTSIKFDIDSFAQI